MIKKDIIETEVRTSGFKKFQDDIMLTNKKIDEYNDELKRLNYEKNKLIAAGQKETKAYREITKEITAVRKSLKQSKDALKEQEKQLPLTALSYNQLKKKAGELTKELYNMSEAADPVAFTKARAELKQYQDQMGKLKQGMGQVSGNFSKNFGNQLWGGFKQLLPIASITSGIALVKDFIGNIWDLSKQMQGESKRAAIVFGDELGYVEMQAGKLAKQAGLTNREFVSMAASTGDLLIPLGFTREQAARMSIDVQKLTGALDEWTAGKFGAEDISRRLTKAMLGETETLKELGIAIRLDSQEYKDLIKQKEAEGAATTGQAQALAILDMLYQKSADAQTAYGSSGNELLRFQKQAALGFRTLKERIVEWFATTKEERVDKLARTYKALSDEFLTNEQKLNRLIPRYNELSSRTDLNETEQKELRDAIDGIVQIVPYAATGFDEYGKALGVNTTAAKDAIEAQRLLKAEMESEVVEGLVETAVDGLDNLSQAKSRLAILEANLADRRRNYGKTQEQAIKNDDTLRQKISAQKEAVAQSERAVGKATLALGGLGLKEDEITAKINDQLQYFKIGTDAILQYTAAYTSFIGADKTEDSKSTASTSLIQKIKDEIKLAENMAETTEAEIRIKNQKLQSLNKELSRLQGLGVSKSAKTQTTWSLTSDETYLKAKAKLREQQMKGDITTEEEYGRLLLALEIKTLENRIAANKEKGADLAKLKSELAEKQYQQTKNEQARTEKLLAAARTPYESEMADYEKRLKELGLFGIDRTQMTEDQQRALLKLEKGYRDKLYNLWLNGLSKQEAKRKEKNDAELRELRTKQNNELAAATTLEQKKAILRKWFSDADLQRVTSNEQAQKIITAQYQKEEQQMLKKHLEDTIATYNLLLSGAINPLFALGLTPEMRAKMQAELDKLQEELSKVNLNISQGDTTADTDKTKGKSNIDILGFSTEQWDSFFGNSDKVMASIDKWNMALQAVGNTFGMISDMMTAAENREFKKYEQTANRKKKVLERQLKSGTISQERYNEAVQRIDSETDAKREEMERKQAKRQKELAVFDAVTSTAVAVVSALGSKPWGPWNIALAALVGALGAVQIATIAAAPLPGFETGGLIGVEREQDGKRFNAEFAPRKRGYVHRPTVIQTNSGQPVLTGEAGTEYVVPNDMLQIPEVAGMVSMIEAARLSGSFRSPQLVPTYPGLASGGYVGGTAPVSEPTVSSVATAATEYDNGVLRELKEVVGKLSRQLEKPLPVAVSAYGRDGLFTVQKKIEQQQLRAGIGSGK